MKIKSRRYYQVKEERDTLLSLCEQRVAWAHTGLEWLNLIHEENGILLERLKALEGGRDHEEFVRLDALIQAGHSAFARQHNHLHDLQVKSEELLARVRDLNDEMDSLPWWSYFNLRSLRAAFTSS